MTITKTDLSSLTYEELAEYFKNIGEPDFHAKQVFKWIARGITDFDGMNDLRKDLRLKLSESCIIAQLSVSEKLESSDGTIKYLFRLSDGLFIETVVMKYKYGNSVCISSQGGCRMGCAFCASTLKGRERNLTSGEMLSQVIYANKEYGVSHVVVMGVGEPLDNYDNLITFLYNINNPLGLNISHRKVSVSTCGLVDKIDELSALDLQITLSVSLHAPDDVTRDKIMPINKKWNISSLMAACKRYMSSTNRRISFEYILLKDINDTANHAKLLSALLRNFIC
ncbi:MAG: Ribosomal large subunit methyltransferase, partial [Clostridia bacterium]|nr:Ribosomal large subunit methyltransferase [Clostridia bacterium]